MINGNLKATYAADERVLDNRNKQAFMAFVLLTIGLFPLLANDYLILIASQMGILLIAITGVNVVIGYTGLMSLGHACFVAVGAYTVAAFHQIAGPAIPEGMILLLAVPLAVVLSAIIGILVGLPSLRVKGLYLAVATLSANFIIIFLIESHLLEPWTGGHVGVNTPSANIMGWEMQTRRELFVLIAISALGTLLLVQNLFRTRVGRAFIAIRDKDYSAEILGISLMRYKLMSFALSAACCGLAGALMAYFYARILPEQFELTLSLQLVAALIVGGMGRTMGPVFGVIVIVMVPEVIKTIFGAATGGDVTLAQLRAPVQEIMFGLLIILFLLFEPLGLVRITDRILQAMNRWPFAR